MFRNSCYFLGMAIKNNRKLQKQIVHNCLDVSNRKLHSPQLWFYPCKMIMHLYFLIVLCLRVENALQQSHKNKDGRGDFTFNFTHILYQSVLLCGPEIICNKSLLAPLQLPHVSNSSVNRCGSCSCNRDCASKSLKNCCPDIYFLHGLRECIDVNILSKEKFFTEVISTCPVGTNEELSKECSGARSKVELLLNPPVSNKALQMIFMNKYCAKCSNVSNFIKWNAEFRCINNTDFNYVSSFQEIIDLAATESCSVGYFSKINMINSDFCISEYYNFISKCNISGSWMNYDKQIDKACQSTFYSPIGIFKNIFCAICNPPEYQSLIIRHCKTERNLHKNACLNLPSLEASSPYKNYYCFLCNFDERNISFYTDIHFQSAFEKFNEDPIENFPFQLTIHLTYNGEHLQTYIKQHIQNSNLKTVTPGLVVIDEIIALRKHEPFCSNENDNIFPPYPYPISTWSKRRTLLNNMEPAVTILEETFTVNISSLVLKSFAFSGHGMCKQRLLPNYTKPLQLPCSCEVGCTYNCCDDLAFIQPLTCIDNNYYRNGEDKDFLAIQGCLNDHVLEPLCTGNFYKQFYEAFPVTQQSGFYTSFVNIFCYLCNRNINISDLKSSYIMTALKIWLLSLECKSFVNYRNFQSLQQLINFANGRSCVLRFLPPSNVQKCSDDCNENQRFVNKKFVIKKCNISGTWNSYDENVLKVCELIEPFWFPMVEIENNIYRNKFCRICNPFKSDSVGNICQGNLENSSIAKACEEFPDVKSCFPYKNIFCKSCSARERDSICFEIKRDDITGLPGIVGTPVPPEPPPEIVTFRKFFTLGAYENTKDIGGDEKRNDTCHRYQMYDNVHHVCRNVTCFPGKYLLNDNCVPFLPFTSNLRYTLGLKINFSSFIFNDVTTKSEIERLIFFLSYDLRWMLQTVPLAIEELIIMGNAGCAKPSHMIRNIFVYIKIFIDENVNREEVEKKLLSLTQINDSIRMFLRLERNSTDTSFNISITQQSLFLPTLKRKFNETLECFVETFDDSYRHLPFRNTFVSQLLICKQLLVQNNDFGIDWTNSKDKFLFPSPNISVDAYQNSGGVRICVNDLLPLLQKQQAGPMESNLTILKILTLACIVISLASLTMTFTTYSIFSNLRTIPGLNNMCLVLSLFLAQLSMVLPTFLRSTGLAIVRAFSHFSWLATFFWLQVCSFHMYRVFSAKSRLTFSSHQTKKVLLTYCVYAFGGPIIIVGANVIITMISSEGDYSGYDKMSTLLTYKLAFVITLIIPLAFMCVTNVIFYILTAYKIFSTPNIENKSVNSMHFSIYVKLFSITGISWLLQIVDMFLQLSFLSYIVAVLNGLQGLFIFVSYVCNRRVWQMYTEFCCKKNGQVSSSSSKTTSTKL